MHLLDDKTKRTEKPYRVSAAVSMADASWLHIRASSLLSSLPFCSAQEGEGSGKRKAEDDEEMATKKAKKYVISDEEEEEDDDE